jgi:adenosylcobyric acid synthase
MQAEACGIEPDVAMNPILLKPTNNTGSQVILNGEVLGYMDAMNYYTHKAELIPHILAAFEKLADAYDIIVIEGAGSPAEINLKDVDIVNMGLAKLVGAPVLLVGDIDRGGVFASLAGTMLLMDDEEKELIKAMIINKFRGDVEILKPGLTMLEEIVDRPVAGVIPYMESLGIDDEDSLSERLTLRTVDGELDVAVIRLPRISNFTDFNALSLIDGVSVRYVTRPQELGHPDMIVLPGTKNTMGDLKWMRESGLEALVIRASNGGTPVFGICGGYQMLGDDLQDPYGVEEGGEMKGLGLLPINTIFEQAKTRTRVEGIVNFSSGIFGSIGESSIYGYEIHMGVSTITDSEAKPLTKIHLAETPETITFDGCQKGNVYGSYVHGIFDDSDVAKKLIVELFKQKGLDYAAVDSFDMKAFKEKEYDRLADTVRSSLDMDLIYSLVGEVTYARQNQ